jgi:hypothetical protein
MRLLIEKLDEAEAASADVHRGTIIDIGIEACQSRTVSQARNAVPMASNHPYRNFGRTARKMAGDDPAIISRKIGSKINIGAGILSALKSRCYCSMPRFGRMRMRMGLHRLSRIVYLLGFCLLTSCLSDAGPTPDPWTSGSTFSPTPFQPGDSTNLLSETSAPLLVPTYTPYPSAPLRVEPTSVKRVFGAGQGAAYTGFETDPLTGLPVSNPGLLERRPLAVKISNYPRDIRPQYGLNLADVVYEYYIEWADTRFIAIFYGNDAKTIGPVRSGRYFDENITRMYHSYYVFNYADPREFNYFLGGDLQQFLVLPGYGSCPPFFQKRVSPAIADVRHYETYFDSTRFGDCQAGKSPLNARQPLRSGFFSAPPPQDAVTVDRIFTHYSSCDYNYWKYEPQTGRYVRFQETSPDKSPQHLNDCSDKPETYAPLIDALTSQQVTADNVIEIYVSHTFASQNEQDDEIYHINLVDSGKAFVFRDGLGIPARWMRTDIDQPLLISTPSGAPIYLKPGRTFFQVIGETSADWSDGADWHFDFHTP